MPLRKFSKHQFAAENQRHEQVRDRHEGKRRARDHGAVEMPGHIKRVMHDQIDLLGTHDYAGDTADEAEEDERHEHAGKCGIAPGRFSQPLEHSPSESPRALRRFD